MKKQEQKRLRISQCMIVKNEEKNIERALSWGKEIMWEQIVVDTGSTDRTVELAKNLGAKVYHFTWIDDFSAAKNYALEQAKGDWIAFLDTDEYMSEEDAKVLYDLLSEIENKGLSYLAVYAAWMNQDQDGKFVWSGCQKRVFRNHFGIHYEGRIHEQLKKGQRDFKFGELLNDSEELAIYHTGYTEQALLETGKLDRNEKLIRKELEERPDDVHMLGYLAHNYVTREKYDQAIVYYEKAVRAFEASEEADGENGIISRIFANLLYYLCVQGAEMDRILEIYEKAVRYVREECDFDYVVGMHFLELRNWEQGMRHLGRALELREKNRNLFSGERLNKDLPRTREYLIIACFNAGERKKCVEYCVKFLGEDRFAMGILKALLTALYADRTNGDQALGFLGKLYDLNSPKERIFLLKAAKETGYTGLSDALWSLFSPQEQAVLRGRI